MPMFDRACPDGHTLIDCFEPVTAPDVACPECGQPTSRVWLSKAAAVIQDSIEGGVWIAHGIGNPDGSPRQYFSKAEMAAEAKRRGLVNWVEHAPRKGTDRSPHTTRWI